MHFTIWERYAGTTVCPDLERARVGYTARAAASLCVGLGLLAACSRSTDSPRATAQAFVDRFFVEANHQAALPLTDGLARAKVQDELRLLDGTAASTGDERPRVYYRELSEHSQDDGMTLYFRLTVVIAGEQPMEPEVMIRVHSSDGQWRVSNFELYPHGRGAESNIPHVVD